MRDNVRFHPVGWKVTVTTPLFVLIARAKWFVGERFVFLASRFVRVLWLPRLVPVSVWIRKPLDSPPLVRFNTGIPAFAVFVQGDPSTSVRLVKPDGYNVLETDGLIQLPNYSWTCLSVARW